MFGRSIPRLLLVGLLVATLVGCSRVKLVYNQLDWLLPYYLGDYVSLTPGQALHLDQELAQLREWHCGTQMHDYVEWLRAAGGEVRSGAADAARIEARYEELASFWTGLMGQTSEHMARLIPQASDEQVVELLGNIEAENEKLRGEIEQRSPAQRRERSVERMEKNLERWIGDLTPAQHDAVVAWSAEMAGGDVDRLAARLSWQQEFRRLLQQRHDVAAFWDGLRRLFTEPERFRSAQVNRNRAQRREATLRLLATVAGMLTPAQRVAAAQRAQEWASDFEDLACADKPVRAARIDNRFIPDRVRGETATR